ncbi:MAG: S9 family peptidase, partial [Polyangiales bacterium]
MRARQASSLPLLAVVSITASLSVLPHCGPETPEPLTPVTAASASTSVVPSATAIASAVPSAPVRPWPATERHPVTDHYASTGKDVVDDYRWLEDSSSPDVKAWSAAQNGYTRKVLDASPKRAAIKDQVSKLMSGSSADWFDVQARAKRLFALKEQPPKQQPLLVVLSGADDAKSEKIIFDPNAADPSGKTAIDWYVASHDGKLVAISLSKGGSESGDVHVFETDGGKERAGDVIARVNGGTAGGSLAWRGDDKGFFYTRYPRLGEKTGDDVNFFQQAFEHTLGRAEKDDVYALGRDFPRIAEIDLHAARKGNAVLARMANGDGGEFSHFYFDGKTWVKLADASDKLVHAILGGDGSLYAISLKDAPRGKVVRLSPAALAEAIKSAGAKGGLQAAEEIVPQSDVVIEQLAVTDHKLFVVDL